MSYPTVSIVVLTTMFASLSLDADVARPAYRESELSASAPNTAKLKLRRFRFHRHTQYEFERLVVEFKANQHSIKTPSVRVTPGANSKQTKLQIVEASLSGAIPERAINGAFSNHSEYMDQIAFDTDSRNSTILRVGVKDNDIVIDSFWLAAPPRLVIDVFPSNSPRASGPGILDSAKGVAAECADPLKCNSTSDNVSCFKDSERLNALITASLDAEDGLSYDIETDGTFIKRQPSGNNDSILCFPTSAKVIATVRYKKQLETLVAKTPQASSNAPVAVAKTPAAGEREANIHVSTALEKAAPAISKAIPESTKRTVAATADRSTNPAEQHQPTVNDANNIFTYIWYKFSR